MGQQLIGPSLEKKVFIAFVFIADILLIFPNNQEILALMVSLEDREREVQKEHQEIMESMASQV